MVIQIMSWWSKEAEVTDQELLDWADSRIGELFPAVEADAIIEHHDLLGAWTRHKRTQSLVLRQNCILRISQWHDDREKKLAGIKSKAGLVVLFAGLGG